ncbi:hypothetical protein ACFOVU_20470 [Nocardiopsis sediminis]|uniref:LytR family transcriptional regulator n=1 Tax=Nocardiopsis sediminis TaxID=1778267 RepID=A0ABV8FR01_9ACTN
MLALLRSRATMYITAALVTLGLVATGAVGLFNALNAPPQPDPAAGAGETPSGAPAPPLDAIGEAPGGAAYSDLGEQCQNGECYRLVGITAEDDSADATEMIDTVYGHLLDEGWARVPPPGVEDVDDVPMAESYLTNGSVLLQGSTDPFVQGSTAGLMLGHAQEPVP